MHPQSALPQLLVPVIRSARAGDEQHIASLINDAFKVEEQLIPGPRIEAGELGERTRSGRFLIADSAQGPVGTAFVDTDGPVGHIELLAVAPKQQKRGIGRRILEVSEALCRADGCTCIELKVVHLRTELLRYYQRSDYQVVGTEPLTSPSAVACHLVVLRKHLRAQPAT